MSAFYGNKKEFALEFRDDFLFLCWINGKNICEYYYNDNKFNCIKRKEDIEERFFNNINSIINEASFPLPVKADTSIDFYKKSGSFDSDDIEEFSNWYEKRQDWYFRHSWYITRKNEFLPDVLFRRVEGYIEISWNLNELYKGVTFECSEGLYYVELNSFLAVIDQLITDNINLNNIDKVENSI
jgi:hypothetical protein